MKRPAFQFYPADWRKDTALQFCSLAAQGLWINAMCIAHECEPYGHLVLNSRPMTGAQIGRLVGITAKECDKLLAELVDSGVCSQTAEGAFFSRRMVRDEDLRNRRGNGGHAGAEHGEKGASHGIKGGRPRNEQRGLNNPPSVDSTGDNKPPLKPPPSSSSSSSPSGNTYSDPDGSGAKAPQPDTADIIFGLGVPALTAAAVPERNARSMLGLMRKTHGDVAVIGALQRMACEKPLQPVAWLQATLKSNTSGVAKVDRIAAANIATALRFAERTA